jgi:BirA family biotin operon repressor/biotin-[acetyl-CoA-carboxylase] ligase
LETLRIQREAILSNLRTTYLGKQLVVEEQCTSTNDVAEKIANEEGPHGAVVIAEKQSKGRGRYGRSWYSPMGGIWFTVLLRPPTFLQPLKALPLVGALAVARMVSSELGIKARVKWPNDVTVDDRKIAGVVVEARSKGNEVTYVLLGVGINANFESSQITALGLTGTSLQTLLGVPINREKLICSVLLETERLYESLCLSEDEVIVALLRDCDCSRGRKVSVKFHDRQISGVIEDYPTLSTVTIITPGGHETIETGTVISVEYESN